MHKLISAFGFTNYATDPTEQHHQLFWCQQASHHVAGNVHATSETVGSAKAPTSPSWTFHLQTIRFHHFHQSFINLFILYLFCDNFSLVFPLFGLPPCTE